MRGVTPLLAGGARHPAATADDVEVTWITPDAVQQSLQLGEAWAVPCECGVPVQAFYRPQGATASERAVWCATTGGHIGFESWLERDAAGLST